MSLHPLFFVSKGNSSAVLALRFQTSGENFFSAERDRTRGLKYSAGQRPFAERTSRHFSRCRMPAILLRREGLAKIDPGEYHFLTRPHFLAVSLSLDPILSIFFPPLESRCEGKLFFSLSAIPFSPSSPRVFPPEGKAEEEGLNFRPSSDELGSTNPLLPRLKREKRDPPLARGKFLPSLREISFLLRHTYYSMYSCVQ